MSSIHSLCQVWDPVHKSLLSDVSQNVTRPYDVCVTPRGVVWVLGGHDVSSSSEGVVLSSSSTGSKLSSSSSSSRRHSSRVDTYCNVPVRTSSSAGGGLACLTLLSPAGRLLCRLSPLPGEVRERLTHMCCPSDASILLSDETRRTVTLYALSMPPVGARQGSPELTVSGRFDFIALP